MIIHIQNGGAQDGLRKFAMKVFTPLPANNPSNIADMKQTADEFRIAKITDIDVQEPSEVKSTLAEEEMSTLDSRLSHLSCLASSSNDSGSLFQEVALCEADSLVAG